MLKSWSLKTFDELSRQELYAILKLRNVVFIIEQNCPYDDIDGKDQMSHHFFCIEEESVIAYARMFAPGVIYKEVCLGRICTSKHVRSQGVGKELMQKTLEQAAQLYPEQAIRISAQRYLKKFYEDFGFQVVSEVYLEDGIEHFQMLYPKNKKY
jgi:ElaA protein